MLVHEKDNLLKKLVDIEQEGKEASYELNKLKDTCRKLKKVKKRKFKFNTCDYRELPLSIELCCPKFLIHSLQNYNSLLNFRVGQILLFSKF